MSFFLGGERVIGSVMFQFGDEGKSFRSFTLGLQIPSEKVFEVGLEGPNTF